MADVIIDDRLLDANCQEKIEENFNRVLDMIDSGGGSGGGGGVFVVELVSDNDGGYTADKTLDEIYAAENEGRPIIGVYNDDGDVSTLLFNADPFFGMINCSENSCDATVFKAIYTDPSKKYYTATNIIWSVTIN